MNIKVAKRWAPLAVLLAIGGFAYAQGWHQALNLESLQAQKGAFLDYAENHKALSILIFMGVYTGAVALSLPIATLLTLLGGFLFGKWLGTMVIVFGASAGASIIFMIAQSTLGDALRKKAGSIYEKISKNMEDNAVGYLLFMRLVPVFPFFLVNILPALFNVSLMTFFLTTFFGIIPATFVYANLGETLGEIETLSDLISKETLLAFGLLGLLALIPALYKQFKKPA